ncbi:MAG: DUF2721 domain-containing protein [Verrucomicrobiota bacterium]|nr:DUF2721 domain-containing protein [Verrucomicrobiota bacterium]
MGLENLIATLQVAVGPVILISGVGLLVLSMTNRLGRLIDRARLLLEACRAGAAMEQTRLDAQLKILWLRAHLLRAAIAWASAGALLAALLVIVLFLCLLFHWQQVVFIVILFGGCMAAIIVSLLYFIRDINLSLHALKLEMNPEIAE